MIASEVFKRYRKIDYVLILVAAVVWLGVATGLDYLNPQLGYLLSLLVGLSLLSFAVLIVKKAGAGLLFMGVSGILTSHIADIGVLGVEKFVVFMLSGLVFEIVFVLLKLEIKDIQMDILGGTAAGLFIPLFMGLVISSSLAWQLINGLINMMLTSFFVGVIASVIGFLIWHRFRTTKFMVKMMYGV
jgi:hypothetical protein